MRDGPGSLTPLAPDRHARLPTPHGDDPHDPPGPDRLDEPDRARRSRCGAHRCRCRQGEEPARAGGPRRPAPAGRRPARRLLRPHLPALLRRAGARRRPAARLRRRRGRGRPDERPLPRGRHDRLRAHHREAGLNDRQPERERQLRLRRQLPLTFGTDPPVVHRGVTLVGWRPVRIAVTGSIATDHLMVFQGRFADSLVVEQLDRLALSFLVDDLEIRRGGIGANIAFGLGVLGERPLLVGAVGEDFAEYRSWLERHNVDCSGVRVSQLKHTARFICTTDREQAQIATFYAGAMSEAREIELAPLMAQEPFDLVVVSPNDPEAMIRHTEEARYRGIPFAADPSQQLAWADGPLIRSLVDGAAYLFSNDYEAALIAQKTGWTDDEIRARVGVRVVTHGKDGVRVDGPGAEPRSEERR